MLQADHPRRLLHRLGRPPLGSLVLVGWLVAGRLRGEGARGGVLHSGGIFMRASCAPDSGDHVILFARTWGIVNCKKKNRGELS